jgi:hypothetical protein
MPKGRMTQAEWFHKVVALRVNESGAARFVYWMTSGETWGLDTTYAAE